jgi:hypothetical protein
MTLEQRLERLERENRWMRRIGAVGVIAVMVSLASSIYVMTCEGDGVDGDHAVRLDAAERQPRMVEAQGFVLRDGDGTKHAALEMHGDGGARLLMWDAEGVERLSLGVSEHGVAGVELADDEGEKWVRLATYAKGGATLTFENRDKASQLYLGVWKDSTTRLSFGRKEKAVLDLWVLDNGSSSMSMSDTEGKVIWEAPKD